MLVEVGRESKYPKEAIKPLAVDTDGDGFIQTLPQISPGWKIVCAFNQWGMDGMAKMYICETLEDMNRLVDSYNNGGALGISWHTMLGLNFIEILSFDEWKQRSENTGAQQASAKFFQPEPAHSTDNVAAAKNALDQ